MDETEIMATDNQSRCGRLDRRVVHGDLHATSAETVTDAETSVWDRIAMIRTEVAERTCGRGLPDVDNLIDGERD